MKAYKCLYPNGTTEVKVIEVADGDAFRTIMKKATGMEETEMPPDYEPPRPTTPTDSEKTFHDIATGAVKHKEVPDRLPRKKETVKIISGPSVDVGRFAKLLGIDGHHFILKVHPQMQIKFKPRDECVSVVVDEEAGVHGA